MSFYLDTNVIYSFIFGDSNSVRAEIWLHNPSSSIVIGDYVRAEFHALVGRRLRGGGLTSLAASLGVADFDAFVARRARTLALTPSAGKLAVDLARDPRLKLYAPDALHLACAAEGGHVLVTFDQRLAEAAKICGYAVETP